MPTRLDGGGGPGVVCLIELYNTSTPCIFCCSNGLFDKYIHIWQHFEHTIRFVHAYIHWLNIFAIASAFWSQHLFARTLVALSLSTSSVFVVLVYSKSANRCSWSKGYTFIRVCVPIVWLQFKRIMFSFSQTYFLSSLSLLFLLASPHACMCVCVCKCARSLSFEIVFRNNILEFILYNICIYKLCSLSASAVTVCISSPLLWTYWFSLSSHKRTQFSRRDSKRIHCVRAHCTYSHIHSTHILLHFVWWASERTHAANARVEMKCFDLCIQFSS